MANLTGYQGTGSRTDIVEAVLRFNRTGSTTTNISLPPPPFTVRMAGTPMEIAKSLFYHKFMPYAEVKWPYEGAACNCEALAEALMTTWLYLKLKRRQEGITTDLPMMQRATTFDSADGMITKSSPTLRAVGGLARGNVRKLGTGAFDGRCLFPNHTFCQFQGTYLDPTFGHLTTNRQDAVGFKLTKKIGTALWHYAGTSGSFIYAIDIGNPAPRFSCSYHELNGTGWISSQDWKTQTARGGFHTRSKDLQAVDTALVAFEAPSGPLNGGFAALPALQDAFKKWFKNNPHEAKDRNRGGCVNGLAKFLGIPSVNLAVVM